MKIFKLIIFFLIFIVIASLLFFLFKEKWNKKERFDTKACIEDLKNRVSPSQYAIEQISVEFENETPLDSVEKLLPINYRIKYTNDNKIFYIEVPEGKEIEYLCELRSLGKFDN